MGGGGEEVLELCEARWPSDAVIEVVALVEGDSVVGLRVGLIILEKVIPGFLGGLVSVGVLEVAGATIPGLYFANASCNRASCSGVKVTFWAALEERLLPCGAGRLEVDTCECLGSLDIAINYLTETL